MEHKNLPRLDSSAYQGYAIVHWSFSIKHRRTGWLTDDFYQAFREILIHGLGRYEAACAAFCLMPDHAHLLLLGWSERSDQLQLVRFLRKHTNVRLKHHGYQWQKQGYDNVLRAQDRRPFSFEKIAGYVLENPVRASLADRWQDWQFSDSAIPGYPDIELRQDDYWDRFWRVYYSRM